MDTVRTPLAILFTKEYSDLLHKTKEVKLGLKWSISLYGLFMGYGPLESGIILSWCINLRNPVL